jgi:hypothetical protein
VCSPATNTCEHEAVAADAAGIDGLADAPGDAAVDAPDAAVPAFAYRRRITIVNQATTSLPAGFTIRVPLGLTLPNLLFQNKVKADFSDLRVIGDGALGERDRIIDPPSGPAPAALSFSLAQPIAAGATNTSYYLYYDDPNAGAAPANGSAVFAVYADFTAAIPSVWSRNDGPAVSGGKLVLRANHTDAIRTTAASDGVPIVSAVELVASISNPNSDPTSQPEGTFYYWFGYQHENDFNASDPWVVWIARGKGQVHAEQKSPDGCEGGCESGYVPQTTAAHYYAIERDADKTRFYLDSLLVYSVSVTNTEDYALMVRNYQAASDVEVDWIRARARVSPDPAITLGLEESL